MSGRPLGAARFGRPPLAQAGFNIDHVEDGDLPAAADLPLIVSEDA